MSENLRILVTGGAGFLGSNLCGQLLASGHTVICLDNFLTGTRQNASLFCEHERFYLVEHDIVDPISSESLGEIHQIYNLACPASPPHYQYDPVYTMRISVEGMLNMLKLAEYYQCPILQASTSEVYGDPAHSPQNESYRGNVNPIGRRACYDEGKRAAETLCFDYQRMHGVNVRVIRIFNTYGPLMHPYDGRVVSNFILQALRGEDITVYGEGQQTRSFCYVEDLLRGIQAMMNGPEDFHGPVNLGNPHEITILQLADTVIKLTGSSSKIIYQPLPADDPTQRCPDISLAKAKLNWEPVCDLLEGLTKTVEYFANLDLSLYEKPTPGQVVIEKI